MIEDSIVEVFKDVVIEPSNIQKINIEHPKCFSHDLSISGYTIEDFQKFSPNDFNVLCLLEPSCEKIFYFPNSKIILINGIDQCKFVNTAYNLVENYSSLMNISNNVAQDAISEFFHTHKIRVLPHGIQGRIYNLFYYLENTLPLYHVSKVASRANTIGATGIRVISTKPLVFVGVLWTTAVVLEYSAIIAGNNVLGRALKTGSWICSRPMWLIELSLNELILRRLSHATGVPLLLNATEVLSQGEGIKAEDALAIAKSAKRIYNSTFIKRVKNVIKAIVEKNP